MPNRTPLSRATPTRIRGVGPTMNRARVIKWMTAGVFFTLIYLMFMVFDGLPPWPVLLWFALSHVFFCAVIWNVRQFRGPYTEPTPERTTEDWDKP